MNHFRALCNLCAIVVLLSALTVTGASAHSMYQSAVILDFIGHEVHVELQLPLERMEAALGKSIDSQSLDGDQLSIRNYVTSRLRAQTRDGRGFESRLQSPLTLETVDGAPYLVARILLLPPAQVQVDWFELKDNVLLDRIPSQVALVSIRSDWRTSVFANDPQLVGVLHGKVRSLTIDRTGESWFRGFASIFHLGMQHIADGTDHLLFLLALLLPAPLLALRSHWAGSASVRQSLLRILKIVTAFTVGHSITLALAASGLVYVPGRPVEVLIAVSILVSAIHALRPIFPGREAALAAFFGLIHGLAFATTLGALGLGRWERVASIFSFNLGIETMQVIVVAATMPSLLLLSRTAAYSIFKISGACFAGLASLGWIVERLLNVHTPVDFVVDSLARQAVWIAGALFFTGLVLWLLRLRPTARAAASDEYSLHSCALRLEIPRNVDDYDFLIALEQKQKL